MQGAAACLSGSGSTNACARDRGVRVVHAQPLAAACEHLACLAGGMVCLSSVGRDTRDPERGQNFSREVPEEVAVALSHCLPFHCPCDHTQIGPHESLTSKGARDTAKGLSPGGRFRVGLAAHSRGGRPQQSSVSAPGVM